MAQKDKIEFQCKTLFSNKRFIVDYSVEGRAGAAVGVFANCLVLVRAQRGLDV